MERVPQRGQEAPATVEVAVKDAHRVTVPANKQVGAKGPANKTTSLSNDKPGPLSPGFFLSILLHI